MVLQRLPVFLVRWMSIIVTFLSGALGQNYHSSCIECWAILTTTQSVTQPETTSFDHQPPGSLPHTTLFIL